MIVNQENIKQLKGVSTVGINYSRNISLCVGIKPTQNDTTMRAFSPIIGLGNTYYGRGV